MPKSFGVEVEPEIIEWFIERSGYEISELSDKIRVKEKTIQGWINGERKPTIRQLEKLANKLDRPIAKFFLEEPPEESLPKDYRTLPGKEEGEFEPKTISKVREAMRLKRAIKEIAEDLNLDMKLKAPKVGVEDDPKKISRKLRSKLNINADVQKEWRDSYKALEKIRKILEETNIFVFQFSIDPDDARGLALADEPPYIIIISSKDDINGRIFTLIHEFGHILLNKTSIDIPGNTLKTESRDSNKYKIERWCDKFASSFLFPDNLARDLFDENRENLTHSKTLKSLSNQYKVSKAVLVYKMEELDYISSREREEFFERPYPEDEEREFFPHQSGDKRCRKNRGDKLISLISKADEKNVITRNDALTYLSTKSKHYDKLKSNKKLV